MFLIKKCQKCYQKHQTVLPAHKQATTEADSSILSGGAPASRTPAAITLKWQSDKPVWIEQRPMIQKVIDMRTTSSRAAGGST